MTHTELDPSKCVFCAELAQKKDIAGLGFAAALRDRYPVTPLHTLIVPTRHVADLFDLGPQEVRDIWRLLGRVREELSQSDPSITAYNVGVNSGPAAGQTVPHVHVHLIPRRDGDTPDPRGGIRGVIPELMTYTR